VLKHAVTGSHSVYIDDFLWLPELVEKILTKHSVTPYEAEEVFFNRAHYL
jgi:hypothetical protein